MKPTISILSERVNREDRITRLSGKIRPGIMVLTKAAQKNEKAVEIYRDGVAKRLKYSEIEKQISDETGLAHPMYPRNTEYFSVAASDFGMPEIAEKILAMYGEDRGEGIRLYRFPVVFHSDDLNEIYPNEFKRYGGKPSYESFYDMEGIRKCRYLPEIVQEEGASRKVVQRLRREKIVRGICNPAQCPEFCCGECKFRGHLRFYIPGITTLGLIEMSSTSSYAAEAIWGDLQRILELIGTIPRYNPANPDQNIFWITKKQETRSYIDENNRQRTGLQWVPSLQAEIDMGKVLMFDPKSRQRQFLAIEPKQEMPQFPVVTENVTASEVVDKDGVVIPANTETVMDGTAMDSETAMTDSESEPAETLQDTAPQQNEELDDAENNSRELEQLFEKFGIHDDEDVHTYFDRKYGRGWAFDIRSQRITEEITMLEKYGQENVCRILSMKAIIFQMNLPAKGIHGVLSKKFGNRYQYCAEKLDAVLKYLRTVGNGDIEATRCILSAEIEK